jgi:hypothetical protein
MSTGAFRACAETIARLGKKETATMTKVVDRHELNVNELNIGEPIGGELMTACEHIVRELLGGVRHGYSKMTIGVEKVQANKTSITVKASGSFAEPCQHWDLCD